MKQTGSPISTGRDHHESRRCRVAADRSSEWPVPDRQGHGDDGPARQRHDARQGGDPGQDPRHHERIRTTGSKRPADPQIHKYAPHAKYVARSGQINALDNPHFVAAVKATAHKTLIIAGTITSVCMAFPAIAAVHEGFKVFAVVDVSRTVLEDGPGDNARTHCPGGCGSHRYCRGRVRSCRGPGTAPTPPGGRRFTPKISRPISC